MKKITLLLACITIFGCSSDGGSDNPTETTKIKLIKEVETDLLTNKIQTINYIYNGDILTQTEEIESDGSKFKTEFVYDAGKLKTMNYFDNLIPDGNNTFTYTGNVVSSSLSFEDNMYFLHKYTYNSKNQMTNAKQYHNDNLEDEKNFEYNSEGNMFKIIYTSYNNGISTLEYDTKNNPYKLIFSEAILNSYDESGYSKNNVTKETSSDGGITTYEYLYNDTGYPTQVIEKYNGVSQYKTVFTYQ